MDFNRICNKWQQKTFFLSLFRARLPEACARAAADTGKHFSNPKLRDFFKSLCKAQARRASPEARFEKGKLNLKPPTRSGLFRPVEYPAEYFRRSAPQWGDLGLRYACGYRPFFAPLARGNFFAPSRCAMRAYPANFFPARPFRKKTAPNSVSVWNAKKSFKIRISSADFQQFIKKFQHPKKFPKAPRFQNPHSSFSKL